MAPRNSAQRRGLVAVVGAVAAASLLAITPAWEGRELKTYRDIGGVLTYCDGATENAIWGKTYTPAECNAQLDRDLERHAAGIAKCMPMERLTDGQKVAFVDAAFNIGVANFCSSSMASKARAGDAVGSCNALPAWSCITVGKGKGDTSGQCKTRDHSKKFVRGLHNRRLAEREMCLKGLT